VRRKHEQGRRKAPAGGIVAAFVLGAAMPVAASPALAPPGAKLVRSMSEIRDEQVVRQDWDLTCGAAAIATLLTYQLDRPVTERQVVAALLRRTSPALVRARLGFSLFDLKVYAATQGLGAAAFGDMTLDDLDGMAPAIVPIRWHGFRHFVVYRGRRGDRVLIADPAFGNRTLPDDVFQAIWAGGVGFVVFDPDAPSAPNRMGAPRELFLAPGGEVERAALAGAGAPIFTTPIGSGP
jgi:predicted double-glycine peptidase